MNKKPGILSIFLLFILACSFAATPPAPTESPIPPSPTPQVATTVPPAATILPPTSTQPASLGTIALDFVALLCDAQWMNGAEHLAACPPAGADHSGGYAILVDPTTEGLPAGTPVFLTIVGIRSNAFFLRYPTFKVHTADRFRATLRCQNASPNCDVDFRLEYYDARGVYSKTFQQWRYIAGQPPIHVDFDLSSLAGQSVDFVLAIQPEDGGLAQNNGALWIAPVIYRPNP
jgi:hypothetical protein